MTGFQNSKRLGYEAFINSSNMSKFHLATTLSHVRRQFETGPVPISPEAEDIKRLNRLDTHKKQQENVNPFRTLAKLLAAQIHPDHQTVIFKDNATLQRLKISHDYWHTHENHGNPAPDGFEEAFTAHYLSDMKLPVDMWEYAESYPSVRRNEWYRDPTKNLCGELYLSWGQLAHLIIDEVVELRELVLNDDDRQFEHLLSVRLVEPVTLRWKQLTNKTQTQLLSLTKPFLTQLYQHILRKRIHHMKRGEVPHGKLDSIVPTKNNLAHRFACIEQLLKGRYSKSQKVKICALYYSMSSETEGPDLFLLDVISHTVKMNRMVTNEELKALAGSAIEARRNKRILAYSHSEYLESGAEDLRAGNIRWDRDETIQGLAKRYREVCMYRLVRNSFAAHLTQECS